MRHPILTLSYLCAALVSANTAYAEPYYNPANSASDIGVTTGSDLYMTIGCPGRGLLDPVCEETAPVAAPVAASIPAPTETPVAKPVEVIPETIKTATPEPEPAPVLAELSPQPDTAKPEECYSQVLKQASSNFRDSMALFFKIPANPQQ